MRCLSQLPKLLDINPFEQLEILETDALYDFHGNPRDSLKRFNFNQLVQEVGAQEACRILGHQRHFKRDFGPIVVDGAAIKNSLSRSYLNGLRLFFKNQPSDLIWEHPASGQKGGT